MDVKKQDLGWEKRIDYRFSVWGTSQNGSSNLLARSTYDILLRYVHLCLTRQCRGGCQWRQDKGLVCLIWPLLQMSSLPAVYSFHLVHIIQKHFQTNPDFRGQATKSLASSDLVCRRVVNWWLVLCCCHHQHRHSERQSSPPRHPSSSGTGIWGILAHSQVMGVFMQTSCLDVLCKAELWAAGLKWFLGKWCGLATFLELLRLQYTTMSAVIKWQLPILFQSRGHGHYCQGSFLATCSK